MYKSYQEFGFSGTPSAAHVVCIGLAAALTGVAVEKAPPGYFHSVKPAYTIVNQLDSSYSGFYIASEMSSLEAELQQFWSSVSDGSVFDIPSSLRSSIEHLVNAMPHIADGI